MCAVSAVGDQWTNQLTAARAWPVIPENGHSFRIGELERKLQALAAIVQQMHDELRAARKQDVENNEPDCEMEDKVALLKKVAEAVGVDLGDVFSNGA